VRFVIADLAYGARNGSAGPAPRVGSDPGELAKFGDRIWLGIFRSGHYAAWSDAYADLGRVEVPDELAWFRLRDVLLAPMALEPGFGSLAVVADVEAWLRAVL
jgi:hypothetical protein